MKRTGWILALAALGALPVRGGVFVKADDFNDGVRNKTLWMVDNRNGGRFVESGGRLRAYSGAAPISFFQSSTWTQKSAMNLVYGDVMEVEAVMRIPLYPLAADSDTYVELMFGMTVPGSSPVLSAYLRYYLNHTGRHYNLGIYKSDNTSIGWGLTLPESARHYVKLRYSTLNGTLTLFMKQKADQPYVKVKKVDLNTHWGLWPGSPVTVTGFLSFTAYKTVITEPAGIYYDNFKARRIRP